MAKAAKQPKTAKQPETIRVRYDLHELPTAQHKAGLAGLLLQIESMRDRINRGAVLPDPPKITARGPSFAEIEYDPRSTQALFDDLYAATFEEAVVVKPWQGKEPKEIRDVPDKTNKLKTEKRFVYDVVTPTGPFLARYTDDGKEQWHKLWRDMLWTVTRGKPTTRGPFNARAEGNPTGEGIAVWADLIANEKQKANGSSKTVEVAGAILLGAQACNAEMIPFQDRADHAVLLHFWQLTARTFVPEAIDTDDSAARGDLKWKRTFFGFLIAIPAVVDLDLFCRRYTDSHFLDSKKRYFYPAESIVSLPAEAAMEYLNQVVTMGATSTAMENAVAVNHIEFFHYEKTGKNTKLLTQGRVNPDRHLQRTVEGIRRQYFNPLFRHHRLRAALGRQPWYSNFDELLSEYEAELILCPSFTDVVNPKSNGFDVAATFSIDCFGRFMQIRKVLKYVEESNMDKTDPPELVDDSVFMIVGRYVHRRTLKRMNLKENAELDAWKPIDLKVGKRRETIRYRDER